MLISIDHGNKQIKTNHRTFVSGLRESDTKPPFGKDVLFYKGKYYTLTDQRIPYMRDKTADERYFILTLFAVAFELAGTEYRKDEIVDVQLAVGLPPAHYGAQYERFENYFLNRDIIDFQLDGRPYSVFSDYGLPFSHRPKTGFAIFPAQLSHYSFYTYKTLRVSCLAYGSRQTRRRTAPGAMTVKTKESALTDMKIRKCAFLCVYTSVVMIICAGRCVPNN